jgi:hypothetical protein
MDDYGIADTGHQVAAGGLDEEASQQIVACVLRARDVREVLRVNERLNRGILSCKVYGDPEVFSPRMSGYRDMAVLLGGLAPGAQ